MEMKIEMQMMKKEEEMKKLWKTVNYKKKKKKDHLMCPPWDTLPCLVLSKIFQNLNFKDRFGSIPLVCKEWNSIISNDPNCWSSMVSKSISPDDAFIKKPDYSFKSILPSKLLYHPDVPIGGKSDDPLVCPGVAHFRAFIKKSLSSPITSLYLDPFSFAYSKYETLDHNEILHLISHYCPNLKHISFYGFYHADIEAVLDMFQRCNKIELIDFSDSVYASSVEVIEVLGKCLPNLRGIRMAEMQYYSIHDAIAMHLPRIKLLAMECRYSTDDDFRKLTSETECCLYELQYLGVGICKINTPLPVCTHIPEFHFVEYGYGWDHGGWHSSRCRICEPLHPVHFNRRTHRRYIEACSGCYSRLCDEAEAKADEAYLEYCPFSKEYEYYVSIWNEKKKETRRRNHPCVVLRTRTRKKKNEKVSKTKMTKKRDKYDYQDYYVQPLV